MFICISAQGLSGLYKLSCRSFLALVNKEGKASGVCIGGACADEACVNGVGRLGRGLSFKAYRPIASLS